MAEAGGGAEVGGAVSEEVAGEPEGDAPDGEGHGSHGGGVVGVRGDFEEGEDVVEADGGMRWSLGGFLEGDAGIFEWEAEDGEEEAGDGDEIEGHAPAVVFADGATEGVTDGGADGDSDVEPGEHLAAFGDGEEVGNDRGGGGTVGGFADADEDPGDEEEGESGGEA